MTQPKNILFGDGAPTFVANVFDQATNFPDKPLEDWTTILDLRNDPDNTIVRRLTLWAHWNYVPSLDPQEQSAVIICAIDEALENSIANPNQPVEALIYGTIGEAIIPLNSRSPVKVLDDYPVSGPIRIVAGTGEADLDFEAANNMVLFGFYTVAGEAGNRAMSDRRPLQIGNTVPVNGFLPVVAPATLPVTENFHSTSADYIDEVSLTVVNTTVPGLHIFFGLDKVRPQPTPYLMFAGPSNMVEGLPLRNCGTLSSAIAAGDAASFNGYFIRY